MKPHIIVLTFCLTMGLIASCNQPFTFKIEDDVPHELLEGSHMLFTADQGFMQYFDIQAGELFDVPFPGDHYEVTVDRTNNLVYTLVGPNRELVRAEVGVWDWENAGYQIEGRSIEIGANGKFLYYMAGGFVGDPWHIESLDLETGDQKVLSEEVGEELFSNFNVNLIDGSIAARSNPNPYSDTAYVYIFSGNGGLRQQILLDSMYTGNFSRAESPKWLPDGSQILQRNRYHNGAFLIDPATNRKQALTNNGFPYHGDITFSPSGDNLLIGNAGSVSVFPFSSESSLTEAIPITGTYQYFASSYVQRVYWW